MNTNEPRIFLPAKTSQPPMPGVPSAEPVRHTPGPWEVGSLYRQKGSNDSPNFTGGEYNIFPPLGESGPVCIVNCNEANARLIAAAPDLLEVAKRFVARWESSGFFEVSHEELAELARAAIAKATQP